MSVKDSPSGRSSATTMRDLLRQLARQADANHPARPNPPSQTRSERSLAAERDQVRVGGWVIKQDALSGDLIAVDPDGAHHTLISRGGA